jgi:hypothetical protein
MPPRDGRGPLGGELIFLLLLPLPLLLLLRTFLRLNRQEQNR